MKRIFNKTRAAGLSVLAAAGLTAVALAGCGAGAPASDTSSVQEAIAKAFANADYKGKTVSGTVKSISKDDIVIVSDDDKELDFELSGDTQFEEKASAPGGSDMGQPPAKPGENGDSTSTDGNGQGQPPAKPEENGDNASADGNGQGQPPAKPEENSDGANADGNGQADGTTKSITADDIKEGDKVSVTIDEEGKVSKITVEGSQGGAPGGSNADIEYVAVRKITEDADITGETIESTGDEENAVLVDDGAKVNISSSVITRNSETGSDGDNASFYGVGAAALVKNGELHIKDSTINTSANGAAGVFAYGDGTVYVTDTVINTEKGASGGIHVAGGGTLYATNVTATTQGQSSAAIRSDRGGGKMVVEGGTFTSNGTGSPAIYSTADISVKNATLTANGSEAICIEGKNSIKLSNCNLTGNMSDDSQNDHTWNVILYQSMSGDSEVGNSTFTMDGGSLTAKNGGMFYTTNTQSTFVLKNVDITFAADSEYFLRASGNNNKRGWGQSGSNGADCEFTGISQKMEGKVIWDSISQLDLYLTQGSELTGSVEKDDSFAGNGSGGYCSLYISEDSTWTVTGNSTVSKLYNAGSIKDAEGKTVTVKDASGNIKVKGESSYTITVDEYSENADMSGAGDVVV